VFVRQPFEIAAEIFLHIHTYIRRRPFAAGKIDGIYGGISGRYRQQNRRGDTVMPLTDTRVRNAKPQAKAYKLSDGGGMSARHARWRTLLAARLSFRREASHACSWRLSDHDAFCRTYRQGRSATPSRDRHMSNNTMLYALYRMGYYSRATVHGFRSMASTALNEMGFRPDVIERQLAHQEQNAVRAAYNRAEYLNERRAMMKRWADHLDAIAGENIVVYKSKIGMER
jgi:integrase